MLAYSVHTIYTGLLSSKNVPENVLSLSNTSRIARDLFSLRAYFLENTLFIRIFISERNAE